MSHIYYSLLLPIMCYIIARQAAPEDCIRIVVSH